MPTEERGAASPGRDSAGSERRSPRAAATLEQRSHRTHPKSEEGSAGRPFPAAVLHETRRTDEPDEEAEEFQTPHGPAMLPLRHDPVLPDSTT